MATFVIVGVLIFLVAVSMTMVGKGGGNFYVVVLAMAGLPMHEAAAAGQFILFSASVAALLIFHRNRSVSWTLAILIGTTTALAALGGGCFSHLISGFALKIIFAGMLLLAGAAMLVPVADKRRRSGEKGFGIVLIRTGTDVYRVNLWLALPVTVLVGFGSGMAGVSGGSFLVPLMVLACRVPMQPAVGTASILIAATSLMGFTGHAIQGDFNPSWALALAAVAVVGGILGGKLALTARPKHLKSLFAVTNWIAAIVMIVNALHGRGIL